MVDAALSGFLLVIAWPAIGYLFAGVLVGLFFGAVPGLSGLVGIGNSDAVHLFHGTGSGTCSPVGHVRGDDHKRHHSVGAARNTGNFGLAGDDHRWLPDGG